MTKTEALVAGMMLKMESISISPALIQQVQDRMSYLLEHPTPPPVFPAPHPSFETERRRSDLSFETAL